MRPEEKSVNDNFKGFHFLTSYKKLLRNRPTDLTEHTLIELF